MRLGKHYGKKQLESDTYRIAMGWMASIDLDKDLDLRRTFATYIGPKMVEDFRASEQVDPLNNLKGDAHHFCIRTLLEGPSPNDRRCDNGCILPPGNDHAEMWVKDEKQVIYTYHPYHMFGDTVRELGRFCDTHNLKCEITSDSWHFPSRSLLVMLRKRV